MKNISLMILGYLIITGLTNIRIVEKTHPCDAFCTQSINRNK